VTVFIVFNTSDSEEKPYRRWIDCVKSSLKEADLRLNELVKENGNKWCSPSIEIFEVDE
jgi:hypothetical protein